MDSTQSGEARHLDEPRLIDYLHVVGRRWRLIAGGTLAVCLIGLAASLLLPRQYRSTATIMVVAPKTETQPAAAAAQLGTYRAILESNAVAAQVLSDTGLDQQPENLKLSDVETQIEEIPATSVLRLHATTKEPRHARLIANQLAQQAIRLNDTLSQDEASQARERVGELLGQARERLDKAAADLLEYQTTAQIDALRRDADAVLAERERLIGLSVDVAAERARLSRAEQELNTHPRVLDIPRASTQEGSLLATARAREHERAKTEPQGEAGREPASVIGLSSSSPFINPVHEAIQYEVAVTRSRLAALQQRERELLAERKIGAAQLPVLTELYRKSAALAEREFEWEIAKKVYEELRLRFEQARSQVTSRSSQVQIVAQAVEPTGAYSPRPTLIMIGAFLLGLVSSLLLAFLLEYLSAVPPRPRDLSHP